MEPNTDGAFEESLTKREGTMNRAVWISRFIALSLTAGVVTFFVVTQADASWQYVAYPLLAGLPFTYGILSARFLRLMHVNLLRPYQARLLLRTLELEKMGSHDELTQ